MDEFGHLDVLVNNAGLFDPGSVYNEPDGTLEHLMAVNLYSAYHVTRSVINHMIAQKSGHIFNMCSIASFKAYANGGAYSISKYALAGFSTNLREEMKPFGIKVTAVYPGAAFTDSWEESGVSPCCANIWATALPNPLDAPVITTFILAKLITKHMSTKHY